MVGKRKHKRERKRKRARDLGELED